MIWIFVGLFCGVFLNLLKSINEAVRWYTMARRGQTAALRVTTCCRDPDPAGPACAWGCFCRQELVPAENAACQDTGSDLLAMQVADPSRQRASGCLSAAACLQGADLAAGIQAWCQWLQGCCQGKARRGFSCGDPLGWEGLVSPSLGCWCRLVFNLALTLLLADLAMMLG